MDIQFVEIEVFAPKAEAAWATLQGQYASRISGAELDHLFACFVLGLTSPAYGEGEPAFHFDLCRALVAVNLPPERAEAALHTVPQPTQPWIASAYQLIEKQGAKIGGSLREKTRNFDNSIGLPGVDAAHQSGWTISRENEDDQLRRRAGKD